jgi:hypothetical protein
MSSLAELPELVGFFSYSREDDEDAHGALSALRERTQRELRSQLGRSRNSFRIWQDKEAIASGKLWKAEITTAIGQSAFFIPIITPTVVGSKYCRFELESFLVRETALGRNDLIFPILYIKVPALDDAVRRDGDEVLSIITKRQYVDWSQFRHLDVATPDVKKSVESFCTDICNALFRPSLSPDERQAQDEAAALLEAEQERQRRDAEAKRLAEEEKRRRAADADAERPAKQKRQREEAEAARRNEENARRPAVAQGFRAATPVTRNTEDQAPGRPEVSEAHRGPPPSRAGRVVWSLIGLAAVAAIGASLVGVLPSRALFLVIDLALGLYLWVVIVAAIFFWLGGIQRDQRARPDRRHDR